MSYPSASEGLASPEIKIAESGTMLDSKGKFNDLKTMLDSNKENIKMDAMRRIITMVARGKDVSELFPAVVKNVAAKNLELKKLVYVYLVRYAEEQQDLALLSISTFQRGLKDPNQLIRASALRVLSSIRVQMIVPVMLLAIKESVRDMSPYVRKVAAHAIPKLYVLDDELQPQLIECIDFLLGDKRTMVLGSAVYAFEQTCSDRLDLLHRHFRLLCRALADVDEWGQIMMIGLLTRYARTQFLSPFAVDNQCQKEKKPLKVNSLETNTDDEHNTEEADEQNKHEEDISEKNSEFTTYPLQSLDPDHNFLINSVRPLLQSRNPAVVMAVAQLLYYIAPPSHFLMVPRALVRLLRGPNEVQYIVLVNIASICLNNNKIEEGSERVLAVNKNLFEPFLKSFFVRSSDTIHVKQLKLQVLTSLVTEANVQLVIRELQAYMQMSDLAEGAIDAVGRCALQVPLSAESCLSILIRLISSNSVQEQVVCASVVVLKRLLHEDAPLSLLKRVYRLIDNVKAPMARACIIWLIGKHIEKVPQLGPELLRKIAKTYSDEEEYVKLQVLNLSVRLWITNPTNREGKCQLLIHYIFQLARYDRSYDIRDRCRFLRNFLFDQTTGNQRHQMFEQNGTTDMNDNVEFNNFGFDDASDSSLQIKFPLEIFLTERPAPVVQNDFIDRAEHFQLGTLSHLLNQKCTGYTELPDFPSEQPDPSIRRTAFPLPTDLQIAKDKKAKVSMPVESEDEEEFTTDDDEEETSEDEDEDEDEEDEDEQEAESDNMDENKGRISTKFNEDEIKKDVILKQKSNGKINPINLSSNSSQTLSESEEQEQSSSSLDEIEENTKKPIKRELNDKRTQMPTKQLQLQKEHQALKTTNNDAVRKHSNEQQKQSPVVDDLLLLDLDFGPPIMSTNSGSPLYATQIGGAGILSKWTRATAQWVPDDFSIQLVVPVVSGGLNIIGRFCRSSCLFSNSMVCLELQISFRHTQIRASDVQLRPISQQQHSTLLTSGPLTITSLGESERRRVTLGIDYGDSSQTSKWTVQWANGERNASFEVQAPYGEQIEAIELPSEVFLTQRTKLGGMNQLQWTLENKKALDAFTANELYKACNCKQVVGLKFCFAGQTVSRKELVLISLLGKQTVDKVEEGDDGSSDDADVDCTLQINCENIAFGSILGQELAKQLTTTS